MIILDIKHHLEKKSVQSVLGLHCLSQAKIDTIRFKKKNFFAPKLLIAVSDPQKILKTGFYLLPPKHPFIHPSTHLPSTHPPIHPSTEQYFYLTFLTKCSTFVTFVTFLLTFLCWTIFQWNLLYYSFFPILHTKFLQQYMIE